MEFFLVKLLISAHLSEKEQIHTAETDNELDFGNNSSQRLDENRSARHDSSNKKKKLKFFFQEGCRCSLQLNKREVVL